MTTFFFENNFPAYSELKKNHLLSISKKPGNRYFHRDLQYMDFLWLKIRFLAGSMILAKIAQAILQKRGQSVGGMLANTGFAQA